MALKTMDPRDVWAALEGQKDVITEAVEAEAAVYKKARCPRCLKTGYSVKRVDPPKVAITESGVEVLSSSFSPDRVLPDGYAHCTNCMTEYCVDSPIIRRTEPFITSAPPRGRRPA